MAQLAASVLVQETTEMPWRLLRQTYFSAKWNRAADRHLAQWAAKYGIAVVIEQGRAPQENLVRFSVLGKRKAPA